MESAITSGRVDDGDPAVVALVSHGAAFCTGTLIAAGVVVTAAHCARPIGDFGVFFGSDIDSGGELVDVSDARVHPDYDARTRVNDIAILSLDSRAPAWVQPVPIQMAPLGAAFVGQPLRIIGFGSTSNLTAPARRKHQGQSTVTMITDSDFTIRPNPSQTCSGDSGGPAFLTRDCVEYLAGIASGGDPACNRFGREVRVDAYASSFLQPYLAGATPAEPDRDRNCSLRGDCRQCHSGCTSLPGAASGGLSAWIVAASLALACWPGKHRRG